MVPNDAVDLWVEKEFGPRIPLSSTFVSVAKCNQSRLEGYSRFAEKIGEVEVFWWCERVEPLQRCKSFLRQYAAQTNCASEVLMHGHLGSRKSLHGSGAEEKAEPRQPWLSEYQLGVQPPSRVQ